MHVHRACSCPAGHAVIYIQYAYVRQSASDRASGCSSGCSLNFHRLIGSPQSLTSVSVSVSVSVPNMSAVRQCMAAPYEPGSSARSATDDKRWPRRRYCEAFGAVGPQRKQSDPLSGPICHPIVQSMRWSQRARRAAGRGQWFSWQTAQWLDVGL